MGSSPCASQDIVSDRARTCLEKAHDTMKRMIIPRMIIPGLRCERLGGKRLGRKAPVYILGREESIMRTQLRREVPGG